MPPKKSRQTGQKLLRYDRGLGVRFVAGADEAGRGPLAGPLVVAGVLLDYECLREHRVRPL
ncbi:MAG: ribonuclease, partial [Gaiellaceae bacterium]|nr:ribonuclease [Gaiellaceae bacterium]